MNTSLSLSWALDRIAGGQGTVIDPMRLRFATAGLSEAGDPQGQLDVACNRLGLAAPRWLGTPDPARLPLLGLLDDNWVVVSDLTADGDWHVLRPGGSQQVSTRRLRDRCAIVRCEEPGKAPFLDDAARADSFHQQLRTALRNNRGPLIEACVASVFIGILALASSLFSMQVYDRVIPTRGEYTLVVLASGVLIAALVELAMKFARAHLMDHVTVDVDTRLSREIFQRLLQLRVDQLPNSVGSLASQIRGYEQVRSFHTASTLFALVDLPLALLFLAVVTLLATPVVALLVAFFGVVALLIGISIRRKVARLAKEGAAFSNMKTGLLVEAVDGVETIKAGSGGWRFLSRWIDVNQHSIHSDLKMRHASESTGYLAATVQQLSYAALIVAGALVVMQGHMTTGALIACSILSGRIINPILALPGLMVQHAHAKAAADGLEKLYQLKTDNHGVRKPLVPEQIEGAFALEGVSFAYGEGPAAFKNDSLRIKPGERLAILGPIGAGKSTLLRLLSGLYVPQEGRVLLDGLDLSHINRVVVSRQVGYLQQEHRLFQGTLRENLLIGLSDPGDQAILNAMRRTGMDRVVAAHPKGLDRPISEGGKGLSGGQRQLVAFTRLVLCSPQVLLLDEPTASMDEEQERQCISVLAEEAARGKTIVIVTHKPSLLPLVDRVVIVAGSSVVMDGPRDAVLRQLRAPQAAAAERATQPEVILAGA